MGFTEVDVQEGTFGFETTSTLGDPAYPLRMGFNTTLIFGPEQQFLKTTPAGWRHGGEYQQWFRHHHH